MKTRKFKLTFETEILGGASANKEIHAEYIASKAPDAKSREEEVAAIGVDAEIEKTMTVFPRNAEGQPIFWDYQIMGFFKEACKALRYYKGEDISKHSCALKNYQKRIDLNVFVFPRQIPISLSGEITSLQRPLRGQTAQGERIALANSEMIPAGSSIEFTVELPDDMDGALMEWLDYGRKHGMGQWRNASYGRFTYIERAIAVKK